jgi:hypothetical protein
MDLPERLIEAVRRTAARLGKTTLTLVELERETEFRSHHVYDHFKGWPAVLTAAGPVAGYGDFVTRWRYSRQVLRARGLSWAEALPACRDWAVAHAAGHPGLAALDGHLAWPRAGSFKSGPRWTANAGRTLGEVINFRGILHAPTTEQEVVAVFAVVARDLDFLIESIRTGFPDCEAKRRVGPARNWQRVRAEIEYLAGNFREHGHDPAGCEMIVCWRNNWPDCPLEVIALEPIVRVLARKDADAAERAERERVEAERAKAGQQGPAEPR